MPALTNSVLYKKLRSALPESTVFHSAEGAVRPTEFTVPGLGRCRTYLFTVTPDRSTPGARPAGEFKIQLIIEGQLRRERGSLSLNGAHTALLGFSPDYGVFVGWEPHLYSDFSYSANVQVRETLLVEARGNGWAVSPPRKIKGQTEVRVAFSAGNLVSFLKASKEADARKFSGQWREAYLLSKAPHFDAERLPTRKGDLESYLERERQRLNTTRLSRNARFAPRVKEQFDYSCALCGVQLEIVEASHIIPVNDPRSSDDIWNGISLCPSHHTLFDARRYVVTPKLQVLIDEDAVNFLKESNRASGIELLSNFNSKNIRTPRFWNESKTYREKMKEALAYNCNLAGIQV